MSRRDQIVMSAGEAGAVLAQGQTVTCATLGRDGRVTWDHRKLGGTY